MRTRAIDPVLANDVVRGLSSRPKRLPSKYLYDERGSRIFERICELPEYYPTRAETSLLAREADEVVRLCAPDELVELGPGSARKTKILLDALERAGRAVVYVPLDVSASALAAARRSLAVDYPELAIQPIVGDFLSDLASVPERSGRRLVAFLGSTLGNLEDEEAVPFLRGVSGLLGAGDRFLVGVDLVKDPLVIERAYNDDQGVTAAFNKNALRAVSHALGGDARLERFEHVAFFEKARSRIEMHLRARSAHAIRFSAIDFEARLSLGETIRTEISRKWTRTSLERVLARGGLELEAWLEDERAWYALALARAS